MLFLCLIDNNGIFTGTWSVDEFIALNRRYNDIFTNRVIREEYIGRFKDSITNPVQNILNEHIVKDTSNIVISYLFPQKKFHKDQLDCAKLIEGERDQLHNMNRF